MSASEELLSLLKTLDDILNRGELRRVLQILFNTFFVINGPRSSYIRAKLQTLHELASSLVDFLDNSPSLQETPILSELEMKMRKAAYKANNILCWQPDPKFWFCLFLRVANKLLASSWIAFAVGVYAFVLFRYLIYYLIALLMSLHIARKGWEVVQIRGVLNDFEMIVRRVNEIRAAGDSGQLSAAVVGLGSHMVDLKDLLTGDSIQLETVSIVGMGEIAKTNLAKHVYNDPYIVNHFDIRLWVTVSQDYSTRSVLLCLLGSANEEADEEMLAVHLHQTLMNKRYLIVMDDVWDTKITEFIRRFSPDDGNGSRVLLIPRLLDVAIHSYSLHQMQYRRDDGSTSGFWRKLKKVVELMGFGRFLGRHRI